MRSVEAIAPRDVASLIDRQLIEAVTTNSHTAGLALIVAFLFAIYGGTYAVGGMIGALNTINDEDETRGFFALTLRAAWLAVLAIVTGAVGLTTAGIFAWLQSRAASLTIGRTSEEFLTVLVWLTIIAFGAGGFSLIMRYGPDRRPAKWRWILPGALLALVLWIVISGGFSLYVAYISNYNGTYGSLAAIVVFVMWLYLSSYVLLVGALLNAELERQTLVDTTVGPDRAMGERGAVLADSQVALGLVRLHQKRERRQGRGRQSAARR
jgi:membrane protein